MKKAMEVYVNMVDWLIMNHNGFPSASEWRRALAMELAYQLGLDPDEEVEDSQEKLKWDLYDWERRFEKEVYRKTMEILDDYFPQGKCDDRERGLAVFLAAMTSAKFFIKDLIDKSAITERSTKDPDGPDRFEATV